MVNIAPKPLSNVQEELLKLYTTGISDENLLELKDLISTFLFEKAIKMADHSFIAKGYNYETINSWLNED